MELKKSNTANLESKRKVFLLVGFVMAFSGVLLAFEWKNFDEPPVIDTLLASDDFEEEIDNTFREEKPPPPPPPPPQDIIVIVEDEEVIEEEFVMDDIETDEDEVVEVDIEEAEEESDEPEFFQIVEDMPEPPGGMEGLYAYITKTMNYPEMAKEAEIEGKVYVRFLINEHGKPEKVEVMRGIHRLCDQEALRVIRGMPAWKPGKQRGKAVKVQFTLPIVFKLK